MSDHFGFLPVGSSLQERTLDNLISSYSETLVRVGGRLREETSLTDPEPLLLFVVTGGTERKILDLCALRSRYFPGEPVLLLAHPGNNSLPAALEVLARLRQDGKRGRILYWNSPTDETGLRFMKTALEESRTAGALRRSRVGLVGHPSDWLVASAPDHTVVRNVWGPEIVPIEPDELHVLLDTLPKRDPALGRPFPEAVQSREPSDKELDDVLHVSAALRALVDNHELDAVALNCFDLLNRTKTTGCIALSQLNDEGVVAACEGDLVSLIAMLMVKELFGLRSWMANPAQIDPGRNTMLLAHCTVATTLVERFTFRSHFESGMSVGIQGEFPPGPVTLVRIGGREMEKIQVVEGNIVSSGNAENLCRTQVEVELAEKDFAKKLMHSPLGNHMVMILGQHAERIRSWWNLMIDPESV